MLNMMTKIRIDEKKNLITIYLQLFWYFKNLVFSKNTLWAKPCYGSKKLKTKKMIKKF